jgi:GNAT superfamily N-acetyltransferase
MKSDARALAALRSAVARGMTERFGPGHWSACPSKAEVVRQMRASHVLVARRGAELIGTVRLVRAVPWAIDSSSFTTVEKPLYVLGLAVAPDCREKGVGRQLMDAAKQAALSWDCQALWLDAYDSDVGAGPFYSRCGFRRVGPTTFKEVALVYYEWLAGAR